jgi:hypothetical protein
MRKIVFTEFSAEEGRYYYIKEKELPNSQHLIRYIKLVWDKERKKIRFKFRMIYSTTKSMRKFNFLDIDYKRKAFEFYRLKNKEEGLVYFL